MIARYRACTDATCSETTVARRLSPSSSATVVPSACVPLASACHPPPPSGKTRVGTSTSARCEARSTDWPAAESTSAGDVASAETSPAGTSRTSQGKRSRMSPRGAASSSLGGRVLIRRVEGGPPLNAVIVALGLLILLDPHHVRPGRVHLRCVEGWRQRLPLEGCPATSAGTYSAHRLRRRRPAVT